MLVEEFLLKIQPRTDLSALFMPSYWYDKTFEEFSIAADRFSVVECLSFLIKYCHDRKVN